MIGLFQPDVGRRLSGHPITNKLVMAVNFSKPDAIVTLIGIPPIPEDTGIAGPGQYISGNVTYTQGINRYGTWQGFSGAGAQSKFQWLRSDFLPTTQGCTVLTLYEKADGVARNTSAFNLNTNNADLTTRFLGSIPYVDGNVYWDYGGATDGVTRCTATGLSFGADRWVFSTGARGMEIWQNGLKRASNSANPSRNADATTEFVLGAQTNVFVFSDIAHYNVFCIWARQLTGDEILMVSADPYMLWENPSVQWALSGAGAQISAGAAATTGRGGWFRTQFVPHTGMVVPRPVGVI